MRDVRYRITIGQFTLVRTRFAEQSQTRVTGGARKTFRVSAGRETLGGARQEDARRVEERVGARETAVARKAPRRNLIRERNVSPEQLWPIRLRENGEDELYTGREWPNKNVRMAICNSKVAG